MISYRSRASPELRKPQTWGSCWVLAALAALTLAAAAPVANGVLLDRGPDNVGNHLIYDTELNVTWYQPNNVEQDWYQAHQYVDNLVVSYQGRVLDDWRLPRATDTVTHILPDVCIAGVAGMANCHGELAHLFVLLGGVGNPDINGVGTDPRPYGQDNPFQTWPACGDPGCIGGGYYWMDESGPGGPGLGGYLIRWNNDTWGTCGGVGPIFAGQTDYKFAWAVRDGDVGASPILVTLSDVDSDSVGDIAVIRSGPLRAEIRSGATGSLLSTAQFLPDQSSIGPVTPVAAAALPDLDGNGVTEIAVLGERQSDGRGIVQIRNVTNLPAPGLRTIWFGVGQRPLSMAVITGDADGNGVAELAVLSTRNSDGRGLVEVKNAYGATNPVSIWAGAGLTPSDVEIVEDADQNGVPEVAVLSTRNSDGRIVVEVKNAAGATNPTSVWFMAGNTAIDLAVVSDKDSNTVPEVAVLSSRDSDGRIVVEVKNAAGPTNPTSVWFMAGNTGLAVEAVADADGNAVPELAVLSSRDSDGRVLVEVKNAAGATNPRSLWYPAGYTARDLAVLADVDGNGIEEAAVLMLRNSDGRIVVQRRNGAGPQAPVDYWFSQ